jgi:hypothetical protein
MTQDTRPGRAIGRQTEARVGSSTNRFAPEESWILEGEGTDMGAHLPIETIQRSIYVVRGQKVMLDAGLRGDPADPSSGAFESTTCDP